MRMITRTAAFLALAVSLFAMPPVPRQSPELTVTDTSGKKISLSSFKGKVVVMPLMFTTCPHCQAEARMLSQLQNELGPGVVMMGVAFNDGVTPQMLSQFIRENNVTFPVGIASRDTVVGYLGLSVMDRWVVPQVAIIDQKGNIVAQSAPTGTAELQDPAYLKTFVTKLLKSGGAATPSAKK